MESQNISLQNQTALEFNESSPVNNYTNNEAETNSLVDFYVNIVFLSTNSFIGIVGNSLSSVVLFQLSKLSSFYLYLAFLALSDVATLIVSAIYRLIELHGFNQSYKGDFQILCSWHFALVLLFSQLSSWITVAVTIDRYVAVCHPFKAHTYCTRKRALIYISTVFLIIVALNFPIICFQWDEEGTSCVLPEFTNDYCFNYSGYVDFCSYIFIPFCLICALNTLTIRGLYKAAIIKRTLTTGSANVATVRDSTMRTVSMLFTVITYFTVTLLPYAVLTFYVEIYKNKNVATIKEVIPVAETVAYIAINLNHSLNFIMYGLSGKRFRDRFLDTYCLRRLQRSSED